MPDTANIGINNLDNLELKDVICEMADDLVSKDTNNEYYKSKYKYSHKDITKI